MKIKTRTLLQIFVAIIIIILALYLRHDNKIRDNSIIERGRYTIGETTGSASNWLRSSSKGLYYKYSVGGIVYKGVRQYENLKGIKTSEGLYIVEFLPEDPTKSIILVDTPVVVNLIVPDSGWSDIPNYIIHLKK